MSAHLSLVVNGKPVRVGTGDTPLADAVADGLVAPVQALHGTTLLGQGAGPAARRHPVRDRRAEPVALTPRPADGVVAFRQDDAAPAVVKRTGCVTELVRLCPGIVEAVVNLAKPLDHQPGHQVEVTVGHAPPVTLTPTLRMNGSTELNEMVFHLACEAGVLVGSLADALRIGESVTVMLQAGL